MIVQLTWSQLILNNIPHYHNQQEHHKNHWLKTRKIRVNSKLICISITIQIMHFAVQYQSMFNVIFI